MPEAPHHPRAPCEYLRARTEAPFAWHMQMYTGSRCVRACAMHTGMRWILAARTWASVVSAMVCCRPHATICTRCPPTRHRLVIIINSPPSSHVCSSTHTQARMTPSCHHCHRHMHAVPREILVNHHETRNPRSADLSVEDVSAQPCGLAAILLVSMSKLPEARNPTRVYKDAPIRARAHKHIKHIKHTHTHTHTYTHRSRCTPLRAHASVKCVGRV